MFAKFITICCLLLSCLGKDFTSCFFVFVLRFCPNFSLFSCLVLALCGYYFQKYYRLQSRCINTRSRCSICCPFTTTPAFLRLNELANSSSCEEVEKIKSTQNSSEEVCGHMTQIVKHKHTLCGALGC